MIEINDLREWEERISNKELTVAMFRANWCPDCAMTDGCMPELEEQYKERIVFLSVDRDKFPELAKELNIFGIPSFVAYQNGMELIRFVSKLAKSKKEIEHFLRRAIQVASILER